ncbi:polyketide cyclase [Marmoricola endophyticus]|uniref:Polyketide cyclase n=1 Tax=Marmoricola endophyticus TaxID=2040280 RepID=A0A917BBL9_9ACTN|nr:SRPBCC family protein [Marmoricola endophyticus]GGF35667.1 polyketide cyclase [Marmoricola endophyticus]
MTQTDTSVTVTRTVNAPVDAVFAVLSDPHKHPALDGSGFVRSLDKGERIEKSGVQFRMNMEGPHMGGEYQTDNVVSAFDENKMIGWKTAPAGQEPPGWEWLWELESTGADSTDVTLTYDWSKVTDQDLLDKLSFPLVTEEQLEDSLTHLDEQAGKG